MSAAEPLAVAARPGARPAGGQAPSTRRAGRTAAGDVRVLAAANLVGAALNLPKFALIVAVLGPRELDVLAVGLLVATTLAQVAGEAIANHAATAAGRGRADGSGVLAALLMSAFVVAALVPHAVVRALAPGLEAAATEHTLALRLLCLAGAATVGLWWVAGEAQRNLDLRGMALVNVVPNLAIVVGLLVPAGDRLVAVGLAMTVAPALCAVVLLRRAGPTSSHHEPRAHGPRLRVPTGLLALLALGLASQGNLVAVRFVGSHLDEGAIAAVYVAAGAALLPAWAVAAGLTGALLPRWHRGLDAGRLGDARVAALLSGGLCAACVAPALLLVALVGAPVGRWAGVDPRLLASLLTALPILLAAAPAASAAWVLRGWMVAEGRVVTATGLAVAGVAVLPVPVLLSPSLAALCVGYGLSALPWLLAVPVMIGRARRSATRGGGRPKRPDRSADPSGTFA